MCFGRNGSEILSTEMGGDDEMVQVFWVCYDHARGEYGRVLLLHGYVLHTLFFIHAFFIILLRILNGFIFGFTCCVFINVFITSLIPTTRFKRLSILCFISIAIIFARLKCCLIRVKFSGNDLYPLAETKVLKCYLKWVLLFFQKSFCCPVLNIFRYSK